MNITKLRWVFAFLFAVLSATVASVAQDEQSRSKEAVSQLAARQFDKVEALFDSTMSSVLPPDKLAATWDSVLAQAGQFKSIAETRQEELQGHHIVFVTSQFERMLLDVKVVWDKDQHIAGLFVVPHQARASTPSDVDGSWAGTLNVGASLRLVFHITNTEEGLSATMDSPDQNAKGIPVTSVTRQGATIKIELKQINGVFAGQLNQDLTAMDGNWSQGGANYPLLLKRVKNAAELQRKRPQNPVKPYPYSEEQVSYDNRAAGIKLAGTLTLPQGKGPFSAAILIAGSGPNDRDESLMGHQPFLVLSDYLTRKGIAVLRFDKRGIGKSGGDYARATTNDFASDAEAGVAFLKSRAEIDPHRIGLIGHSEGGIIAPIVAARSSDVAFIVLMAGTGVRGDDLLVEQVRMLSLAHGRTPEEAQHGATEERELLTLVEQEKDNAALLKKLHERMAGKAQGAEVEAQIQRTVSPWFREMLVYDPATSLAKVKCPVLALNGDKDTQVSSKQNLPAIRKALETGGNKNIETDELLGLNHLFQAAKSGSPVEYAEIEETISPSVLEKISGWILQQPGEKPRALVGRPDSKSDLPSSSSGWRILV